MFRRLALTAAASATASLAVLAATPPAAYAEPLPPAPLPHMPTPQLGRATAPP